MNRSVVSFSVLLVLLSVASACSVWATFRGYPGPELPADRVGTLYIFADSVSIDSLDGVRLEGRIASGEERLRRIFVLPGRHTITVSYSTSFRSWPNEYRTFSPAPITLAFDIIAGGSRTLQAEVGESTWRPFIQ